MLRLKSLILLPLVLFTLSCKQEMNKTEPPLYKGATSIFLDSCALKVCNEIYQHKAVWHEAEYLNSYYMNDLVTSTCDGSNDLALILICSVIGDHNAILQNYLLNNKPKLQVQELKYLKAAIFSQVGVVREASIQSIIEQSKLTQDKLEHDAFLKGYFSPTVSEQSINDFITAHQSAASVNDLNYLLGLCFNYDKAGLSNKQKALGLIRTAYLNSKPAH